MGCSPREVEQFDQVQLNLEVTPCGKNSDVALPVLTRVHKAIRLASSGAEGQAKQTERKISSEHLAEVLEGTAV